MASASPKKTRYVYTPLAELSYNKKVDVYGVVKFVKHPYKTRGSDYCMMISLVDGSFTDPEDKLKCLLFGKDINQLPVAEVGDIVRFHRLKVSSFKGSLQGQSGPGWSWVIFSGETTPAAQDETSDKLMPLKASTSTYTLTDVDKQMVEKLRKWSRDIHGLRQEVSTLNDTAAGCYFNLVCQVVSTWQVDDTCTVLQVWDGTQCSCTVKTLERDTATVAVMSEASLIHKSQGFTYDVFVFDDHVSAAAKTKPKDYVKFTNLHAAVCKTEDHKDAARECIELVLHRGSAFGRSVKVLPLDSTDVNTVRQRLDCVSASISVLADADSITIDGTRSGNSQPDINSCPQPGTSGCSRAHCSRKYDEKRDVQYCEISCSSEGGTNDSEDTLDEGHAVIEATDGQALDPGEIDRQTRAQDDSSSRCMLRTVTVGMNHPHINVSPISEVLALSLPCVVKVRAHVYDYHPKPSDIGTFIQMICPVCYFLCSFADIEHQKQKWCDNLQPDSTNSDVPQYVCPQCSENRDTSSGPDPPPASPNLQYTFMLRFLLKDNTGLLMTNVWQQDAIQLLLDIKPEDILCSPVRLEAVRSLLDQLCPAGVPLENRPWLECCLKAYTSPEGSGYQIFDTATV